MYEKCIKCERLGKECIPNLYTMSVTEIRDWARKLKAEKGWSNAYLAEISGVSKGTIDSNFSKNGGKCADVNYSTFSPVLCALIGSIDEMPCNNHSQEYDNLSNEIQQLKIENAELREKLNNSEEHLNKIMEDQNKEFESRVAYYRDQLKWKRQVIVIMIIVSCVLLSFILLSITIDWLNNDLGFIWRF